MKKRDFSKCQTRRMQRVLPASSTVRMRANMICQWAPVSSLECNSKRQPVVKTALQSSGLTNVLIVEPKSTSKTSNSPGKMRKVHRLLFVVNATRNISAVWWTIQASIASLPSIYSNYAAKWNQWIKQVKLRLFDLSSNLLQLHLR